MYLRFTVGERDLESHTWKGLFGAVIELRNNLGAKSATGARIQQTLDWFNEHLPVPTCFGPGKNPRAICWFRPDAGEPLTKMWSLVNLLDGWRTQVHLHKTKDPGRQVYRDEYQIVAVPQAKPKVRTFRLR